ncbi:cyclic-phosphate processing receiver domain-containing protein [Paenibacillus sp. FSL H7-0331]|uniref:cyclic-phosphate processing receiver domain-containing protein n=1 Tax=Paenibacillus sp. FSL H7-0331 TaxID=1920421 RepID=UPI002115DB09|nr:cyclic-phosphate processing receiver domain-containing protein [Paenibacillus sp. FSL H7-0331]
MLIIEILWRVIAIIHVFLDDVRLCPTGFVAAHNAEECILLLQECEVGVLSLDFDLGWGQPTGLQVASFLASSQRFPREIYLHTSSWSGKQAMHQLLYRSKPESVKLVNGPMPHDTLQTIANTAKNRL